MQNTCGHILPKAGLPKAADESAPLWSTEGCRRLPRLPCLQFMSNCWTRQNSERWFSLVIWILKPNTSVHSECPRYLLVVFKKFRKYKNCSVADLHWLQCEIRTRIQGDKTMRILCGSGSGSWSDFAVTKSWNFTWKNILYEGNGIRS